MRRLGVTALAATQAAFAALVMFAVFAIGFALAGLLNSGTGFDLGAAVRSAANVWLVGHGAGLHVTLPRAFAAATGLAGAGSTFAITAAPLGVALVSFMMGRRIGLQGAATDRSIPALVGGWFGYLLVSLLLTWLGQNPIVAADFGRAALLAPLPVLIGSVFGVFSQPGGEGKAWLGALGLWLQSRGISRDAVSAIRFGSRTGAIATLGTVAGGALVFTGLVLGSFGNVVALQQALGAGLGGDVVLTLAQIAVVPNLVLWSAANVSGASFTLGGASSVSPWGSSLGSLPGLPLFGAFPTGAVWFAALCMVLLMIVVALAAARAVGTLSERAELRASGPALIALVSALVAGLLFAGLALASGGAVGPGRLSYVGAQPLFAGLAAAAVTGVAALAGGYLRWAVVRLRDSDRDVVEVPALDTAVDGGFDPMRRFDLADPDTSEVHPASGPNSDTERIDRS